VKVPDQSSPDRENRELRRQVILAVVQGFAREALATLLREIWRGGAW
jgi:hypothetical protein